MLMAILLAPLMVFCVLYVSLAFGFLFTGTDYRPDMNMVP